MSGLCHNEEVIQVSCITLIIYLLSPAVFQKSTPSKILQENSECQTVFHPHLGPNCCKAYGTRGLKVNVKIKKKGKYLQSIKKREPHLTLDTIYESDKNTRKHHTQERQKVSPFTTCNHKAARNRQDSITRQL